MKLSWTLYLSQMHFLHFQLQVVLTTYSFLPLLYLVPALIKTARTLDLNYIQGTGWSHFFPISPTLSAKFGRQQIIWQNKYTKRTCRVSHPGSLSHFSLWTQSGTWVSSLCTEPSFPRNTHQYNLLLIYCSAALSIISWLMDSLLQSHICQCIHLPWMFKEEGNPIGPPVQIQTLLQRRLFFKTCLGPTDVHAAIHRWVLVICK